MSEAGVYVEVGDLIRLRHQARGFSFLPQQPVFSLLAGRHSSRLRGRGLNFEEIRAYLPGDDIRSIDWKVTARTRKPHSRVYTEERDRPTLVAVDQRQGMFFGSQVSMKSVTAAEAAALALWRVDDQGDRAGGVVFDDLSMIEIRPHRSYRHLTQLLTAIVEKNNALRTDPARESRPGQFNDVLHRLCRLAAHNNLVVLISDMDGMNEESDGLIRRLCRHNDVLAVLIYDPLETELPDLGQLVISDGRLQIEVDSGDAKLRQSFAQVFSDRLEDTRQALTRLGVPVLPVHTAAPVAQQVRTLLGRPPRHSR